MPAKGRLWSSGYDDDGDYDCDEQWRWLWWWDLVLFSELCDGEMASIVSPRKATHLVILIYNLCLLIFISTVINSSPQASDPNHRAAPASLLLPQSGSGSTLGCRSSTWSSPWSSSSWSWLTQWLILPWWQFPSQFSSGRQDPAVVLMTSETKCHWQLFSEW